MFAIKFFLAFASINLNKARSSTSSGDFLKKWKNL